MSARDQISQPQLRSVTQVLSKSLHKVYYSFIYDSYFANQTDLTPEMLLDGSWRTRDFKQVNLDAMGAPAESGALHPLLKVLLIEHL